MAPTSALLGAIEELAGKRPLFHSEADFQHALAWHLHVSDAGASIRLEVPVRDEDAAAKYLDLFAVVGGQRVAVELKYKTRKFDHEHSGEVFALHNHGAQDLGRYDFLLDVQRLEHFVRSRRADYGLAILLTNDPLYWSTPSRDGTVDTMFRLTEDRIVSGSLAWLPHASPGTTKGRTNPIQLRGKYTVSWRPYAKVGSSVGAEFRHLAWQVD